MERLETWREAAHRMIVKMPCTALHVNGTPFLQYIGRKGADCVSGEEGGEHPQQRRRSVSPMTAA